MINMIGLNMAMLGTDLEKAASDARGACGHFLGHFLYVLVRMEEEKFVRFGNKDLR